MIHSRWPGELGFHWSKLVASEMSYGLRLVPPGKVIPLISLTRQYVPVTGALATWAAAVSRISRAVAGGAGRTDDRGADAACGVRRGAGLGPAAGAPDIRTATAVPAADTVSPAVSSIRFVMR